VFGECAVDLLYDEALVRQWYAEAAGKGTSIADRLLRWYLTRGADAERMQARTDRGVLLGSGFVGGEGLLGVGIAAAAFMLGRKPDGLGHAWAGDVGAWALGAVAFSLLAIWFARRVRA